MRLHVGRLNICPALALHVASQPPSMLTKSNLASESQEVLDAWWAWESARPLGRVLQQPPTMHEQEIMILKHLDIV